MKELEKFQKNQLSEETKKDLKAFIEQWKN